jgi:hypothetical protein
MYVVYLYNLLLLTDGRVIYISRLSVLGTDVGFLAFRTRVVNYGNYNINIIPPCSSYGEEMKFEIGMLSNSCV